MRGSTPDRICPHDRSAKLNSEQKAPSFPDSVQMSSLIVRKGKLYPFGGNMKTRDRQRQALKRKILEEKIREELLEYRDCCGIPDPTPYEAVKNCIRRDVEALALQQA